MPKSRQKQNESRNHKTTEQRGAAVNISYNKLWKLLVDKKMSKADLRRETSVGINMFRWRCLFAYAKCSIAISAILSAFAGMMQRGICRKVRQNK